MPDLQFNLLLQLMQAAGQKLIGAHDFRNFCKMDVRHGVIEFIRSISRISIDALST
jgi:tRNA pseudouridine38/39 synthase